MSSAARRLQRFEYLLTVKRHIMTGTGAYFYIVWGVWLRHCLNGREREYKLNWPSIFSLPEIVRNETYQNGSAKKGQ